MPEQPGYVYMYGVCMCVVNIPIYSIDGKWMVISKPHIASAT